MDLNTPTVGLRGFANRYSCDKGRCVGLVTPTNSPGKYFPKAKIDQHSSYFCLHNMCIVSPLLDFKGNVQQQKV